ncbi:E7 [Caretta caretta papillomavirus 1]|uniref:E7 n=1 Tax=Caretta caretta papillomavirus 1 TaxID=485241 RepID=B6RUP9_9PAPI|nr:E7 [Caretta caretta papillomavirus 1]ACD39813.1 E7 [Caretta caretta papillomavirus 1]
MHNKGQPIKGYSGKYMCACCRKDVSFAQQEICIMLSEQLGMLVCMNCEVVVPSNQIQDALGTADLAEVTVSCGIGLVDEGSDLASYSELETDTDSDNEGEAFLAGTDSEAV